VANAPDKVGEPQCLRRNVDRVLRAADRLVCAERNRSRAAFALMAADRAWAVISWKGWADKLESKMSTNARLKPLCQIGRLKYAAAC